MCMCRATATKPVAASWWASGPKEDVRDRVVLVLDDILDEGETMAAIRDKVLAMGAKSFHSAVFANKLISKAKTDCC